MIISKTPYRNSLGGGGTDLHYYFQQRGGSLVTAGIDKYVYIIVQKGIMDKFLIRYSKTEVVENVNDIQHELIRESLRLLNITEPIEITASSDIPAGTGLGSSSSYLVGILHALHAFKGERVSKKTLAEEATRIQTEILRSGAGLQDQYAAAYGSMIHLNIAKNGRCLVTPVDISNRSLTLLEENLVYFYTGIRRRADEVLLDQAKVAKTDEQKVKEMDMIKEIGDDSRKALETGNIRRFGQLLNIHWETKKKLSGKMTSSEIDSWYNLALENGAIGGKIMGAGGGGFFMFYVEQNKEKLIKAMEGAGLMHVPMKFDHDGTKIIFKEE